MSNGNRESSASGFKGLLAALAVFLGVGIIAAVVLCWKIGHESVQEKAANGVFSQKTIDTRDQNLAAVTAAQDALVDRKAISAAEKKIVASAASMKAVKSDIVVPGSPTFMKQMEAASAAAAEAKKAAEVPKAAATAPSAAAKPVEKKPQAAAPKKAEKVPAEKPKAPPVKAEKEQPKDK